MPAKSVFRFAPSPNGELHLGHVYSALFTARMARVHNGRFLLRMEDIDIGRSRRVFENRIYDDLGWLGLNWEQPVRRQSEHFDDYRAALDRLIAMEVVYPSFASRGEIKAIANAATTKPVLDPDGQMLYPEICQEKDFERAKHADAFNQSHAWRLDMTRAIKLGQEIAGTPLMFKEQGLGPASETGTLAVTPDIWGDVVIARKEIPTCYHLSVVVDDATQNITHVTRGQDLFYATHIHRLLQVLLGLPAPVYHHHKLILDDTGRRLSKSARDQSLRELRAQGKSPTDLYEMVGLTQTEMDIP